MPPPNICLLFIALPLLAAVATAFFGKKHQNFAQFPFLISCLLSLFLLVYVYLYLPVWPGIKLDVFGSLGLFVELKLQTFGFQILALVNFIGLLVGWYSVYYMKGDDGYCRYYTYLGLFVMAMAGLVLAADLLSLYVFWELVGFGSYLLIGFWYQKPSAVAASQKAFLMNRIGDFAFMLGIFLCFRHYGSLSFSVITTSGSTSTAVSLLLFMGCVAKSAQFPLHNWLPTAMEGPTPVSALIHAATMVAAGIYMLVLLFGVFSTQALLVIAVIGAITMLMAGIKAFFQNDIKKVLAYSTVSQLGLMVLAVGLGQPQLAFYHLFFHAFFKSGLFLCAGSVIHELQHAVIHQNTGTDIDCQNIDTMGGLYKKMPLTAAAMAACAASMAGLPLFSGFVSKDLIVEAAANTVGGWQVFYVLLLLSAVITAAYSARLLWLVFAGKWRGSAQVYGAIHEKTNGITVSVLLLAVLSTQLATNLQSLPSFHLSVSGVMALLASLLGIGLVLFLKEKLVFGYQYRSVFDTFYQKYIADSTLKIAEYVYLADSKLIDGAINSLSVTTQKMSKLASFFDAYLVDGVVKFFTKIVRGFGRLFVGLQSGQLQWYLPSVIFLLLLIYLIS
jgi:NADH-quinone oxidoreductase subunit L